ncbi:MAG: hypothetical protein ACK5JC_10045 [Bacteroidota bacterium]|jgi:hypothetical protein
MPAKVRLIFFSLPLARIFIPCFLYLGIGNNDVFAQALPKKRLPVDIRFSCTAPAVLGGANFKTAYKGSLEVSGGLSLYNKKSSWSVSVLYRYTSVQAGINALALSTNIFTEVQLKSLMLQISRRIYEDDKFNLQAFAGAGHAFIDARRTLCLQDPPRMYKNHWQSGIELGMRAQERVWVALHTSVTRYAWAFDYREHCLDTYYTFPKTSPDKGIWFFYVGLSTRIFLTDPAE